MFSATMSLYADRQLVKFPSEMRRKATKAKREIIRASLFFREIPSASRSLIKSFAYFYNRKFFT